MIGALSLAVAACSVPGFGTRSTPDPRPVTSERAPGQPGAFKVGEPYQINGVWYHPAIDYDYRETGIASWYGPGFHGNQTANGEIYDQNLLTAAHRTLPMPSFVKVTNLENGRQVALRVNDRGPFARGRIIDVSSRAAELLDFKTQGVARVRVEILEEESRRLAANADAGEGRASVAASGNTGASSGGGVRLANTSASTAVRAAATTGGGAETGVASGIGASLPQPDESVTFTAVESTDIYVQAGSFVDYENATRLQETLDRIARASIEPASVHDRRFYRVRLGPLKDVGEADRLLDRLFRDGHHDARVIVD